MNRHERQRGQANLFNSLFRCNCPLVGNVTHPDGTTETVTFPDKFHRLWHSVTSRDQWYFKQHPEATNYMRDYIEGETWPKMLPAGTRVLVCKINNYQQARAFELPKGSEATDA